MLDRYGHINGAAFFSFFSGLTILVIWMFARFGQSQRCRESEELRRNMGVLILFAILQGATSGIIWSGVGAVSAQVVGLQGLSLAFQAFVN
jgi:MFS family permease